jgi:hypothetical protein
MAGSCGALLWCADSRNEKTRVHRVADTEFGAIADNSKNFPFEMRTDASFPLTLPTSLPPMASKRSAPTQPEEKAKYSRHINGKSWCHVNPYTMNGMSPSCIMYQGIQLSKLPEPFMLVQWLPADLKRRIIFDYCPGITAVSIYLTNHNFAYELGVTREGIAKDSEKRYNSKGLAIAHRMFDDPYDSQDERMFGYYALRYLFGRATMGAPVNNAIIETLARRDKPEMLRHFIRFVDLRFVARAALQHRAIKILKNFCFDVDALNRLDPSFPKLDWPAWSDWPVRDGSIFTLNFSPAMITAMHAAHCKDPTQFENTVGPYVHAKKGGLILRGAAFVLAARFGNQPVMELFKDIAPRSGLNCTEISLRHHTSSSLRYLFDICPKSESLSNTPISYRVFGWINSGTNEDLVVEFCLQYAKLWRSTPVCVLDQPTGWTLVTFPGSFVAALAKHAFAGLLRDNFEDTSENLERYVQPSPIVPFRTLLFAALFPGQTLDSQ